MVQHVSPGSRFPKSQLAVLVEATPEAFRTKGSFKTPVKTGPGWPHPVIHDGKLYLRDHNTLMCYEVRAER